MFVQKGAPRLSRLSLGGKHREETIQPSDYIFAQNEGPQSLYMDTLVESLPILRVDGVYFYWNPARASNLVILQLDNLMFATPIELLKCVGSISSAPQLCDLKLTSVNCIASRRRVTGRKIRFPNLEVLTLNDLYLNVLQVLFSFLDLDPDSHYLTLGLTYHSFCYRRSTFRSDPDHEHHLEELVETLNPVCIDSLLLDDDVQRMVGRNPDEVSKLLGCMPELETLVLSGWRLGKAEWQYLVRPDDPPNDSSESHFPRFQHLHLIRSVMTEEEGLKNVVESHQIQLLELGVRRYDVEERGYRGYGELVNPRSLSEELLDWLRSKVAEVRVVGYHCDYPHDFTSGNRDLW